MTTNPGPHRTPDLSGSTWQHKSDGRRVSLLIRWLDGRPEERYVAINEATSRRSIIRRDTLMTRYRRVG